MIDMKDKYFQETKKMIIDLEKKLGKVKASIFFGDKKTMTVKQHHEIEEMVSLARDVELSSAIYHQLKRKP
jgi:hypothetical protein